MELGSEHLEVLVHVIAPDNRRSDKRWISFAESYKNFEPVTRQKLEIVGYQQAADCNSQSSRSEKFPTHLNRILRRNSSSNLNVVKLQLVDDSKRQQYLKSIRLPVPETCSSKNFEIEQDKQNLTSEKRLDDSSMSILSDPEIESIQCLSHVSSYKLSSGQIPELDDHSSRSKIFCRSDQEESTFSTVLSQTYPPICMEITSPNDLDVKIRQPNSTKPESLLVQRKSGLKRIVNAVDEQDLSVHSSLLYDIEAKSKETKNSHIYVCKKLCMKPQRVESKDTVKSSTFSVDQNWSTTVSNNLGLKSVRWSEALEIHSAPPRIGNSVLTPNNLISKSLHVLAERGKLEQNFQPTEMVRELLPMERGYWHIICSSWDQDLRIRCWNYLGIYIEKDNSAGWGVWCVRDENFDTIRVYCWGIIIGHLYLLLLMASEGKICKKDVCWIDASGKEVVKMNSVC